MSPRPVIWLAGMPRSGTNWGSQILDSAPELRLKFCPLFSWEFKNRLDETASSDDWDRLFADVYATPGDYLDQHYLRRQGLLPTFAQQHAQPRVLGIKSTRYHTLMPGLLEKAAYVRLVVLVRNPIAAVHSWLSNPLEFPAGARPEDHWRNGACRKSAVGEFWGYEDWKRSTLQYLDLRQRFPDRVCIVRYEDLVADPLGQTREVFRFAGLVFGPQTESFLRDSTSRHSSHQRSVFKSREVATRWQATVDPRMRAEITADLVGGPLAEFLNPSSLLDPDTP
mgnify:CR=1 FL=1